MNEQAPGEIVLYLREDGAPAIEHIQHTYEEGELEQDASLSGFPTGSPRRAASGLADDPALPEGSGGGFGKQYARSAYCRLRPPVT